MTAGMSLLAGPPNVEDVGGTDNNTELRLALQRRLTTYRRK